MPQINILSPHVADLIAAGEVVERPASAVKELLENAADAGARTVVLDLRRGGRGSIRVSDDGCGMAPEDAGVCFLRHATSKLKDEKGLEAIGTMGFRGEALAAISAVSRITMTTRARGTASGVRMEVTAGEIDSMEEWGCPEGTVMEVRDLFFNTPARQKFLGNDRAEGVACVHTALTTALGRPEISFRCLRDGQEEFFSPGDGKAESAVYALLGREFAQSLLPMKTENEGITVTGFISEPNKCRGNRSGQYFFCNGRPIRSKSLTAALEQAYKHSAMVGKFPACVLYITLPEGLVDVNVHPTKLEVKFAREKAVFDAVYYGTLSALGKDAPAAVSTEEPVAVASPLVTPPPAAPQPAAKAEPKKDFFRTMTPEEFKKNLSRWEAPKTPARPAEYRQPAVKPAADYTKIPAPAPLPVKPAPLSEPEEAKKPALRQEPALYKAAEIPAVTEAPEEKPDVKPKVKAAEPEQTVLDKTFTVPAYRFIGECMKVYILVEMEDRLILIDKHAAHERLLFDRMRLGTRPLMSQDLLLPETLHTDPEADDLITANMALLENLGFRLEPFGDCTWAVRSVPADVDAGAVVPLLEELVEKLREGRSLSNADIKERLAETMACKAAIKAGWTTSPEELKLLADRVLSGEVTHCPHGRPVMTSLSRQELDKRFGRIV